MGRPEPLDPRDPEQLRAGKVPLPGVRGPVERLLRTADAGPPRTGEGGCLMTLRVAVLVAAPRHTFADLHGCGRDLRIVNPLQPKGAEGLSARMFEDPAPTHQGGVESPSLGFSWPGKGVGWPASAQHPPALPAAEAPGGCDRDAGIAGMRADVGIHFRAPHHAGDLRHFRALRGRNLQQPGDDIGPRPPHSIQALDRRHRQADADLHGGFPVLRGPGHPRAFCPTKPVLSDITP